MRRPDYKKVCWSCGAEDMEPVESYYRCRSCGATYNVPVHLGADPMTVVDDETGGSPRERRPTHGRPSGRIVRSAEKARVQKVAPGNER